MPTYRTGANIFCTQLIGAGGTGSAPNTANFAGGTGFAGWDPTSLAQMQPTAAQGAQTLFGRKEELPSRVVRQRMRFHPDRRPIAVIRCYTGDAVTDSGAGNYNPYGLTRSNAQEPMSDSDPAPTRWNIWDSGPDFAGAADDRFRRLIARLNFLYDPPYRFRRFMLTRPAGLFTNIAPIVPIRDIVPSACWHVDDSTNPPPNDYVEHFDLYRQRFEGTSDPQLHVKLWFADRPDAVLYIYLGFRLNIYTSRRIDQAISPTAYRPDLNGLEKGPMGETLSHLVALTKNLGVYGSDGGWMQLGAPGQVGFCLDNAGGPTTSTPNRDAALKVIRWVRRRGGYAAGEAIPHDTVGGLEVPRGDLVARAAWLAAYQNQIDNDPDGLWIFSPEAEAGVFVLDAELAASDPQKVLNDFHSRGYILLPTDMSVDNTKLVVSLTSPFLSWRKNSSLPELARGSERSYLFKVKDGSVRTAYPRWAGPGIPRYEDRNDGWGRHLLLEGARTNLLLRSEELDQSAWTKTNVTASANAVAAPDGEADADALTVVTNGSAAFASQQVSVTNGTALTFSVWCRAHTNSPATVSIGISDGFSTQNFDFAPSSTQWQQKIVTPPFVPSSSTATVFLRVHSAAGTGTSGQNILFWGAQLEAALFASSYIRTGNVAVTAAADVFLLPEAPTEMRSGKWSVDVWPDFANTDLADGDAFVLFSFSSTSDVLRIKRTVSNVRVEAVVGGVVVAQSQSLTFGPPDPHLKVLVDPQVGVISVNATAGAAGTPWGWPSGSIRVGGVVGAANEAFARIGEPLPAL